jgi:hypothetical protein
MASRFEALRQATYKLCVDRRGVSAAEFALILPVFTLMVGGVMQYGVLFYTYNVALNGARSAARALAVGAADQAGAEAIMAASLPPWVSAARGGAGSGDEGDHDCGGGNGDSNDTGGYGPGGCGQAGNGKGNGNGNGNGNGGAAGSAGGGGDVQITATDASVGAEVRARIVIPSARATVLPLAPMPDSLTVSVAMVKEG